MNRADRLIYIAASSLVGELERHRVAAKVSVMKDRRDMPRHLASGSLCRRPGPMDGLFFQSSFL